ncbi:MAG TPA: FAD-dependent oxidoreductase [Gammaproteobacteria bacterium]|nr:FAD-dependent oxidoreductase [Gammaproteobacteria bacterium]
MSIPINPIVIVGSGLAGYTLAQEFRKLNSEAPLIIVTGCDGRYYYKPSLSNALVKNQVPATFAMAEVSKMQERLKAVIHTKTRVTGINPAQRQLYTQNQTISYSKLVLACGANVVAPPVAGGEGVMRYVNNMQDYEAFRDELSGKKHIVILGAGFVGCEFANTLLDAGYAVSIIAPARYPLEQLLPEAAGLALERGLAVKGAKWHLQDVATNIEKKGAEYQITLASQALLSADLILSTIGLRPDVQLAKAAGLAINRGIQVNRHLQTSCEDIYALGDCAEVEGLVLQFVAPLLQGARALAKTLAGERTEVKYPAMPVVLKTPACPTVLLPAPIGCEGEWQITGDEQNIKALFVDTSQRLRGFALTGTAVTEKNVLSKEIPELF